MRAQSVSAQNPVRENTEQKVEHLTVALAQAQAQMDAYQAQLMDMRQQLAALKEQMAAEKSASPLPAEPAGAKVGSARAEPANAATLEEIQERQAIEESQIATHDVIKVETESKFPLKVSGLVLFNAFVNTRQVDVSASPGYALPGPGTTGLSLRQTVLGLDARGPHWFGATSQADIRADFFASGTVSNYAAGGVLRLRTAHAALDWPNTEAFVELDRSILEPNEPSSLVAIAQPELAWAGNLWVWNPQIGVSHQFALSESTRIKAQAALIDSSDPLLPGSSSSGPAQTETERSRWPGTEARIAFQHGMSGIGPEIGAGGYFSPHRNGDSDTFDAWAGTMDARLPLSRYFELTANEYRGQALAGLGAGGYVNFYYSSYGSNQYVHALDDVGGWTQLKARAGQRVEMNAGFGTDNPFAKEIQAAVPSTGSYYAGFARNRSFYSNAILSPSAYLMFSVEYRRLWTNFSTGPRNFSDAIGIGAGYKF
ncbi:MAG: cell envelope integrity protein TolA [Terracidiphilus sp.]